MRTLQAWRQGEVEVEHRAPEIQRLECKNFCIILLYILLYYIKIIIICSLCVCLSVLLIVCNFKKLLGEVI